MTKIILNVDTNRVLKHFGVKGMKWGVRRYQNKDGSLTPLGLKKQEKKDDKWLKKNEHNAFYNAVARNKGLDEIYRKIDWEKAGMSKEYGVKINQLITKELNKTVSSIKPPSNRTLKWVAVNSGSIGDVQLQVDRG